MDVGKQEELGHQEEKDDRRSCREHRGDRRFLTHLEHLCEADADGDEGGEKGEEVGDLWGGVAVEEAAQVNLVLKGECVFVLY